MTDLQKLIISAGLAFTIPVFLALIVTKLISGGPGSFLVLTVVLNVYTFYFGFQRNGELERSVGAVLGQFTPWIIPTGISWWIPKPFGTSLIGTDIARIELDRTKKSEQQLTQVLTSNNTEVEVSYYAIYEIINLRTWVKTRDQKQAFQTIMDRGVRWFVNNYETEEIAGKKEDFSKYLTGNCELDGGDCDESEESIADLVKKILGVKIISVKVDDVNLPKEVIDAREKEAAEKAQAAQEELDIKSLADRADELAQKLDINPEIALRAAQAARGDIRQIVVDGNAGDFTKGAAVNEQLGESK